MGVWKDAGEKAALESLTNRDGRLEAALRVPAGDTTASLAYALTGEGAVRVELTVRPGRAAPELPRVGVSFALPAAYAHVRWFGRGPQENYIDRCRGAAVRLYRSTVEEWITPYVRPQENANRTGVRWIELADAAGSGARIRTDGAPFGVSAWPYTAVDLSAAAHNDELPRRDAITVNVDAKQMGVGGDNSWGLPVHPEYRLPPEGEYRLAFTLEATDRATAQKR
jgi:beta-galactosidase